MPRIIENVVYQHAENACSLWWQWKLALSEPHYDFQELQALEHRINSNLHGLLIAGDGAEHMLLELADAEDEGANFALAVLCLKTGSPTRFMALLDERAKDISTLNEFESALLWTDDKQLEAVAHALLESEQSHAMILGMKTCLSHCKDLDSYLSRCAQHDDPGVRATAIRMAAELGRERVVSELAQAGVDEPREQFEQARALAMLGHAEQARAPLKALALGASSVASDATRLLLLMSDSRYCRDLLKQIDALDGRERDVVRGFGLVGDPAAMDWLLSRCEHPALARLAGESVSMITGVDLAETDLDLAEPLADFEAGPDDDPDNDEIALDEDDNLPWPDAALIRAWWSASPNKLASRAQYLCGLERTESSLRSILQTAKQRQRRVAADLIALAKPGSLYCNTHNPTDRQKNWTSA